jgi:hypothetical protein
VSRNACGRAAGYGESVDRIPLKVYVAVVAILSVVILAWIFLHASVGSR